MLVACYVLVHGNDIVIYTYEIQQIHVTFYLVSKYKCIRTCGLHNNHTFCMLLVLLRDVCTICTIAIYEVSTMILLIAQDFVFRHLLFPYGFRFFAFLLTLHFEFLCN